MCSHTFWGVDDSLCRCAFSPPEHFRSILRARTGRRPRVAPPWGKHARARGTYAKSTGCADGHKTPTGKHTRCRLSGARDSCRGTSLGLPGEGSPCQTMQ
eukprot:9488037-Pyramimonas_sp.AAC.1